MADAEHIKIDIVIAGRTYNLTVKAGDKDRLLKTVDNINKRILGNSTTYAHRDTQDLLAMAALQYADAAARYEAEKTYKDRYLEQKLNEINELLGSETDQ